MAYRSTDRRHQRFGCEIDVPARSRYVAVEPPHRVTFTWKPSWDAGSVSTVSYRLEPIDGGTRVVLRHEGLTDPASCRNHANGWPRIFGWLTAHLVAPEPVKYVMTRLVPPRPDFAIGARYECLPFLNIMR